MELKKDRRLHRRVKVGIADQGKGRIHQEREKKKMSGEEGRKEFLSQRIP